MRKRLISIAVALSIIASLFTVNMYSSAATSYVSPNMAILENILYGDRQFVIDTLIGTNYKTDFSTNPHALVNYIGDENTMMDNVLSQYRNENDPNYKASYKIAVDIMEKVYNGDDYVQHATDWVTSFAADLLSIFSSDAQTVMDDLTYSVGELQYESILKEVLATDYTSSDGTTLSTKEIELENLERLDKGLKNLKDFASFFKADASANHMSDDTFDDRMDYYNKFLIPYTDSVENVLGSFADIQGTDDAEDLAAFITALAMVSQMDRFESANAEISSDITYYAPTFFIDDDTLGIVKSASSSISTVSKTLSTYMFINSIGTQKEAVGDTLTRMSNNSKNSELNSILNTFASEVGEAGNAKLMGYESLMQYLRNAGAVNEFGDWAIDKVSGKVSPYVEKFICENLDMAWEYSNAGLAKTAASTILAKATNVAGISSWCADKTMSFGDTCKKTYELKYLEKIIKVAVDTYNKDVQTYLSNKTEDNAENVLDDLLMIQKLRLRGETIAYKMTYGQWNSPLGRLLANGTLNQDETLISYLDNAYQYRVDALIGASAMPFTSSSITVKKDEKLTIYYEDAKGGLYGVLTTADKNSRNIGEFKYRVANGIHVQSGGEVLMVLVDNPNTYIPYIVNNGGLVQFAGNAKISEYTQNSGTTTLGANTSYINSLHLNGGTLKSAHRDNLACKYFDNSSGTVTLEIPVYCENLSVKGKINGSTVYLTGDSNGGGGSIESLCVSGSVSQNLSGTLNATNLDYSNTGTAKQSGTIYVSGTVKNTSSQVTNGQNTILKSTGEIIGSHYNSSITIDGVTIADAKTINGMLKIKNTVNLGNVNINGALNQTNGTLNLNGHVNVSSDSYFGGTVIQGDYDYFAKGDISGSKITLGNLNMCGNVVQTISNAITTNDFYNNNTNGLNINAKVTVNGKVKSVKSPVNGQNITLQETASFENAPYYGDVTVKGLLGGFPTHIYGKVYLQCDVTQLTDTSINNLIFTKGTLSLQEANLTVRGILNNSATDTYIFLDDTSALTLSGDATISGSITGTGSLISYGDIKNSGTINVNNLIITANTPISISGQSITTLYLTTNGKSKINLSSQINVLKEYTENNSNMDSSKVVFSQGNIINDNVTYDTPLNVTGDLIINGYTLIAKKGLTLKKGNITLTNGAKLIVNGKTSISNTSGYGITVDETSSIEFNKLTILNTLDFIKVNGSLKFGSDVSLTSTTLSGDGTISLAGDMYCSSVTINQPKNFKIIGKTPQTISASGANFNNLYISNSSHDGVTFSSSVNCYGEYNKNDSNVSGTVKQK